MLSCLAMDTLKRESWDSYRQLAIAVAQNSIDVQAPSGRLRAVLNSLLGQQLRL